MGPGLTWTAGHVQGPGRRRGVASSGRCRLGTPFPRRALTWRVRAFSVSATGRTRTAWVPESHVRACGGQGLVAGAAGAVAMTIGRRPGSADRPARRACTGAHAGASDRAPGAAGPSVADGQPAGAFRSGGGAGRARRWPASSNSFSNEGSLRRRPWRSPAVSTAPTPTRTAWPVPAGRVRSAQAEPTMPRAGLDDEDKWGHEPGEALRPARRLPIPLPEFRRGEE